jgi:hypothetical protein
MEITGTIISMEQPTKGVSKAGKEWTKQLFVIETKDQYPKKVAIEVMGDKVSVLSHYTVGYEVTASINIESREYNGRYYTTVQAWKLAGTQENAKPQASDPFAPSSNDTENGLPF